MTFSFYYLKKMGNIHTEYKFRGIDKSKEFVLSSKCLEGMFWIGPDGKSDPRPLDLLNVIYLHNDTEHLYQFVETHKQIEEIFVRQKVYPPRLFREVAAFFNTWCKQPKEVLLLLKLEVEMILIDNVLKEIEMLEGEIKRLRLMLK